MAEIIFSSFTVREWCARLVELAPQKTKKKKNHRDEEEEEEEVGLEE